MKRLGLLFLFTAMCASAAPVALFAQRAGGGEGQRKSGSHGATPAPSTNGSSVVLDALHRPSFPVSGPFGATPSTTSPFAAGPGTFAPQYNRRASGPRSFGIPLGYGFGTPGFYGGAPAGGLDTNAADEGAGVPGVLYVDATPRAAQVFVDSTYVGTVDDLFANGVTLTGGRHWVEIEAPAYEKKLVEVSITPGQGLRYRADLSPARRAAPAVVTSAAPETMYAIPGCYGGNKPPVASDLPPGCDVANLRVIKPPRAN